jgi:DNA-binding MarR family transcriptional regulator
MGNMDEAARGSDVSLDEIREVGSLIPAFLHALKTMGPPPLVMAAMKGTAHLTPRHLTALHHILLTGPQSVGELAGRLHVALPTASLLVSELDRAGLVERAEDPADRRRTIVRITDEHWDACTEFLERRVAPVRRTLGQLKPAERRAFVRGLETLVSEFRAVAGDAAAEPAAPAGARSAPDPC